MTDPSESPQAPVNAPSAEEATLLGLSTNQLAGLTVEELVDNKVAITMLTHYYKLLLSENTALKNDINTMRTIVASYEKSKDADLASYEKTKDKARIGAVLLLASNISIGFGVNLLTSNVVWPGIATLTPGIIFALIGLFLSVGGASK